MLRRTLAGLTLVAALSVAACQPGAVTTPAPAAPTGIVLQNSQPQPQPKVPVSGGQAQPQAPVPTPPTSFLQGAEKSRSEVPVAPQSPNSGHAEVKPTTEPAPVKAIGPTTVTQNKLLYVRNGRLWIAQADGKDQEQLLDKNAPQIWSPPKDAGRAWVSPSGRLVVYYAGSAGAVWVTDIETKASRQVLERGIPAPNTVSDKIAEAVGRKLMEQEIAWSPDESQFALQAAPQGQVDVFVVNVKSGQGMQVNNDAAVHNELVWSPKGDALAFRSRDENGNFEKVFVLKGQQLIMVPTDRIAQAINETDLGGALTLTWIDDTRFFFYPLSSALQSLGIWVYNTTDSTLAPIYTQSLSNPAYHQATRRWTFISADKKNTLFMLELGAPDARMLLPEGGLAPIWTPDGKQIVYSTDNGETYDVHIMNIDGSGDKKLAAGINFIGDNPPEPSPAGKRFFSPDGKWLTYAAVGADYGTTGNNLENWWTVPLDGSQPPSALTDIPKIFYIRQLQYSPDKAGVAFTGFRYADRTTHLWTFSQSGGNIVKVDAEVRWFRWLGPQPASQSR